MTNNSLSTSNIIDVLRNGVTQIQFQKSDGTVRTMNATLQAPRFVTVDEANSAERSDGVVNVFDIDIGAWRSFRVDSLISYTEQNA